MVTKFREVIIDGNHLKDKKIAFVVMSSTAAYKVYDVIAELRRYGCEVFPYVSKGCLKYVTKATLEWVSGNNLIDDSVDNSKIDEVVIYPMTSEFKSGLVIKDNIINKLIYNHKRNKKVICFVEQMDNINYYSDFNVEEISNQEIDSSKIVRMLSVSNLRGKKILVTAGPTPVKIDSVRRITNKFSGKLGIEIATELYLRGADVTLLQSYSGIRPPAYLNSILFRDYDEYKDLCLLYSPSCEYGIFSAAVADYKPKIVVNGKIPSGGALTNIELVKTDKVINLVKDKTPNLKMISFKYEEGKTLDQLLEIANKRLQMGHLRVVANDLSLNSDQQKCFLCGIVENKTKVIASAERKTNIARMIADDLENL